MDPSEGQPQRDPLADILTLVQAEQMTGIAAHTFAQQAEKGVLQARKVGHTWITTRSALEDYVRLHARRGHDVAPSTSEEPVPVSRTQVATATPRKLLVAVDGSSESLAACRSAFALARSVDASITLLHVAQPHVMRSSFDSAPQWREAEDAAQFAGEQIIEQARSASGSDLPFTGKVVFGDPAGTICRCARELGTDVIVIGSRGLGTFKRLLLGSVSSAVSQQAPCSVLVVRERAGRKSKN